MTTHRSVHWVGTASLAAGVTLALLLTMGLAQPVTAGNVGPAGCRDSTPGVIRPNGLFHDGGPLYVWPSEPNAFSQVILTLRTYACDAQAASLVYQLTADQPPQIVGLHWLGRDRTGYYDLWQAVPGPSSGGEPA